MIIKNLIICLGQFYFGLKASLKEFYQNSSFYDKKISKTKDITFDYKPSPYLLSSIINSISSDIPKKFKAVVALAGDP